MTAKTAKDYPIFPGTQPKVLRENQTQQTESYSLTVEPNFGPLTFLSGV